MHGYASYIDTTLVAFTTPKTTSQLVDVIYTQYIHCYKHEATLNLNSKYNHDNI